MSHVLVFGANGMLGHELVKRLPAGEIIGVGRSEVDITNPNAVDQAVAGSAVVINSAAYTSVDDAESNKNAAFAVNADGARNIAVSCRRHNTRLIHLSTDYIFDGYNASPYTEASPGNPQSVYGASKYAGEQAVLTEWAEQSVILRTSWLYGVHGQSFPRTILLAGQKNAHLDVVDDQTGQPTWTGDVVNMISQLLAHDVHRGVFHATNGGSTTWHGFASALFDLAGWDVNRVRKTSSDAYVRPAPRPQYSVLGHENWTSHGLPTPRDWREALAEAWSSGLSTFAHAEDER